MTKLPGNWKRWIVENLLRGVPATTLHHTLIKEGFSDSLIRPLLAGNLPDDFAYPYDSRYFSALARPSVIQHPQSSLVSFSTPTLQLYQMDEVFSQDECAQLCSVIKQHLRPSDISTVSSGTSQSFRTSSTCDLSQVDQALTDLADKRIQSLFGPDFGVGEPIQAQHYAPGQAFKAHTDYFEPATSEYRRFAAESGQRTWTCMVYLNVVEEGGDTEFLHIGKRFSPQPGRALFWNNLDLDGNVNTATLHQAHPVINGEKTVITKWFRTPC
ncbi:prolyl hydroxylase family protein [Salinimonas chungwhensis]|uniref:prolyl hydroxylase family protein n=1 Tax=Salinimonas chungwhensis TaxID=265425 RepID=UPI000370F5B2|nr:2OG-Fe(II) oxygenase [Salinimonas chungwhensis]